ncbi:MAG: N-acetylmuramoyl-L-alanine amidase [Ruminococcus sp.]
MAKRIYLSPSNQFANYYATGSTNEMAQCDKIAKATATALKRCGFEVKVGKSGDSMLNRCNESDSFNADIHMPIHTNAYNGQVTGGTRIFCLNSNGRKACQAVLNELGKISPGTADSITYQTGLYEINVPNALTVYVECEFHDTKTGSDWIRNNITNIGEAICKGLCSYFGVKYKSASAGSGNSSSGSSGTSSAFKSYIVRITPSDGVNIRKGAGTDYAIVGAIAQGGAYTIVAEKTGKGAKKWGKLKSGAGWIALDFTEKIE